MAFGNNRMMKIGRLILVLVTMANALPALTSFWIFYRLMKRSIWK